jgi:ADP-ribosylglycohydrolase
LVAFAQTDSLEDCLIAAASYYGDSDSVCALAGALAGAYYGFDAIPSRWLTGLQNRELLDDCWARTPAQLPA